MKNITLALALGLTLLLAGCAGTEETTTESTIESQPSAQEPVVPTPQEQPLSQETTPAVTNQAAQEEEDVELKLSIAGTSVDVEWEDNQAVTDLKELASNGPITIELSMYGGFEQVGPLGANLSTNNEQMTTSAGDIVLYAGNQISIFYNPNSWSYTRLGHITNKTANEMAELLGRGDVSITISVE